MLFLVIDKGQESRILQVEPVAFGIEIVSEVCSRRKMLLDDLQGHNLLLDRVKDVAPKASKTAWLLEDSLLGSANRQVVMDPEFSKVTLLDNIPGNKPTLTEPNNVNVRLPKDRVILNLLAVFFALFVHRS